MSGRFDARLLRRGAITGSGAFVGGSILVFAFMLLVGDMLGALASVAPIASATFGYNMMHAWAALLDGSPALLVFALIPAAILVGAGYSAASQTDDVEESAAARGAAVIVGYLSLTVLSVAYLFVRASSPLGSTGGTASSTASGGGGVDVIGLVLMIGFTGVLFPLVFGALGGRLAQARGY